MMQVISTTGFIIPFSSCKSIFPTPSVLNLYQHHLPLIFQGKNKELIFRKQMSQSFGNGQRRNLVLRSSIGSGPPPPPPPPPNYSPGSWKGWILGVIITTILPFWMSKLGPLLKFTKEVEAAVETAEQVTEIVEYVAEEVEKVAEEVADTLPEGGKLRIFVTEVEIAAKETAKDARLADEFIEKVEEVEKDVESFFEPGMDHGS